MENYAWRKEGALVPPPEDLRYFYYHRFYSVGGVCTSAYT